MEGGPSRAPTVWIGPLVWPPAGRGNEPSLVPLVFVVAALRAGATVDDFDWRAIERQLAVCLEEAPVPHGAQDSGPGARVTGKRGESFP